MGEFPELESAIRIINSLAIKDEGLGSLAFKKWKDLARDPNTGKLLDAAQCVELAREELYGQKKEAC